MAFLITSFGVTATGRSRVPTSSAAISSSPSGLPTSIHVWGRIWRAAQLRSAKPSADCADPISSMLRAPSPVQQDLTPGHECFENHVGELGVLGHEAAEPVPRDAAHLTVLRHPRGQVRGLAGQHVELTEEATGPVRDDDLLCRPRAGSPNHHLHLAGLDEHPVVVEIASMKQHVAGVDVLRLGQCANALRVILAQDRKRSVVRGPDAHRGHPNQAGRMKPPPVRQDQGMLDPLALGRSVVVGPGDAAPREWSSCERIRVGAVNRATADELGAAWRERRSLIVELVPGLGLDDPEAPPPEAVTGLQPWEWSAGLDLVAERLHHGVWANSMDARHGTSSPRWRWADVACQLGASRIDGEADVVGPDGTPAACDGGPLDASLPSRVGMAVIHRISLEHGSLRPLGASDPVGILLAPDQLEAVAEPKAVARVIAPAGSGKTRVLTERARLLLRGWGLPPAAVALVAYNTRAANEMRGASL